MLQVWPKKNKKKKKKKKVHIVRYHLHRNLVQTKQIRRHSESRLPSAGTEEETIGEGHKGTFWDDGNGLYLNCGYDDVC